MNNIVKTLKDYGIFFVASNDGDGARVRPFSSVTEIAGKVYICTNNTKDCYKQFIKNPKVEICTSVKEGSWVRVTGKLVRDDRDSSREAMLKDPTGPANLYKLGDGIFEVFALEDAKAVKYTFTSAPEEIKA